MAWTNTKTTMVLGAAAILAAGATIGFSRRTKAPGHEALSPKAEACFEALPPDLKSNFETMPPEQQARLVALNPSEQLSPFTMVRYEGDTVFVTCDGVEYQLAAIDDLAASDLLDFCRKHYDDRWHDRFAEDLVLVLDDMGHPVNADHTVSLSLIDPKTAQKKDIAKASMTRDNRDAVHKTLPGRQ